MSEEKILMKEGEDLARIAVDSGMGSKQLQIIYRLAKTRPLAFVEAHIMRQMGRDSVKGVMAFARVHELLKKYENSRQSFIKVLMYALMLYGYVEKEPLMKPRIIAEPIIKRIVEAKGMDLNEISMRLHGRNLDVKVRVNRLFTSPKALSDEIANSLKRNEEFSNLNLRVWIESR